MKVKLLFPCTNWKLFTCLLLTLLLFSCSETDTIEGGVYAKVLLLEGKITYNSRGQVVFETDVNIPLTGPNSLGEIGLTVGYEKVLYDARNKAYKLILIWEDDNGEVWTSEYDIGKPFNIKFENKQRVREISNNIGEQSIVVLIETDPASNIPKSDQYETVSTVIVYVTVNPESNPVSSDNSQKNQDIPDCPGAPVSRLSPGMKTYVCTKEDRLIIVKKPAKGSVEIVRLYPGQEMLILKGPTCDVNSGRYYWKIRTDYGTEGWAAEGGDETDPYWICPK